MNETDVAYLAEYFLQILNNSNLISIYMQDNLYSNCKLGFKKNGNELFWFAQNIIPSTLDKN